MFDYWESPSLANPTRTLSLSRQGALAALKARYATETEALRLASGDDSRATVFTRLLDEMYDAGAGTVVIEYRYVDADYRSEHSKFYSTTFRGYPGYAHRLHFFRGELPPVSAKNPRPFPFRAPEGQDYGYMGYVVMRPVGAARVGRAFLAVPETDAAQVLCLANDTVNLLGTDFSVEGIPFYAQDGQLNRCGQAAMLTLAYYHHRVFNLARTLSAELSSAVEPGASELGRPIPSPGLQPRQLTDAAIAVGLPPYIYELDSENVPDPEATICRYLNSRLPVIIVTSDHAFVLVGYERMKRRVGDHIIRFFRQDDEIGHFQAVDRWERDAPYGDWLKAIVPLPEKVYLNGDIAESIGATNLKERLRASSHEDDKALNALLNDTVDRPLSFRTTVVRSNDFKRTVTDRGYPDSIAAIYQSRHMSRFIWVVELTNRAERDAGDPSVYAEVLLDSTDHERDPSPITVRLPSGMIVSDPDSMKASKFNQVWTKPIRSVVEQIQPHNTP